MSMQEELSAIDRRINNFFSVFITKNLQHRLKTAVDLRHYPQFQKRVETIQFMQIIIDIVKKNPNYDEELEPYFERFGLSDFEQVKIFNLLEHVPNALNRRILDQHFFLQNTALPYECVVAHGCAGTGKQQGLVEKIRIFYEALTTPSPLSAVSHGATTSQAQPNFLSFILGDNVYDAGCQQDENYDLKSYFHDIYCEGSVGGHHGPPWNLCFGVLGNHDYNYINPLLRLLYRFSPMHASQINQGPNIALNEILQSYRLYNEYPNAYKAPLLPLRYYVVNTSFALYFCLDTNVLLFDVVQQTWLINTVQYIASNRSLREKHIVIVCHQPLQTFGKRSKDNGDFGYYAAQLTDESEKNALNDLIFGLMPHQRHDRKKGDIPARIPHSILLRRFCEHVFLSRGLRINMVLSAHDHFNEASIFGVGIMQIIAGVGGLIKDKQNDKLSLAEIERLQRKKTKALRVFQPLQALHEHMTGGKTKRPFTMVAPPDRTSGALSVRQREIETTSDGLAFFLQTATASSTHVQRKRNLAETNFRIKEQISVPLCIVSAHKIQIFWHWHPSHGPERDVAGFARLTDPIILENPSKLPAVEFTRAIITEIASTLAFISDRFVFEKQKYHPERMSAQFTQFQTIERLYIIMHNGVIDGLNSTSYFPHSPPTIQAVTTAVLAAKALINDHLLNQITRLYEHTTHILHNEKGIFSVFTGMGKSKLEFYQELHYHLMDLWCLCMNVVEEPPYQFESRSFPTKEPAINERKKFEPMAPNPAMTTRLPPAREPAIYQTKKFEPMAPNPSMTTRLPPARFDVSFPRPVPPGRPALDYPPFSDDGRVSPTPSTPSTVSTRPRLVERQHHLPHVPPYSDTGSRERRDLDEFTAHFMHPSYEASRQVPVHPLTRTLASGSLFSLSGSPHPISYRREDNGFASEASNDDNDSISDVGDDNSPA